MKKSHLFACIALMALSVSTTGWCADPNPQSDPNKPTQEQSKKKTRTDRWGETKKQKQQGVTEKRDADAQQRAEKAVTDHGLSSDTSSKDLAKALDMTASEKRAYEERLANMDSSIDAWEQRQKANNNDNTASHDFWTKTSQDTREQVLKNEEAQARLDAMKMTKEQLEQKRRDIQADEALDGLTSYQHKLKAAINNELATRGDNETPDQQAARLQRAAELEAEINKAKEQRAEEQKQRESQMQEDRKILEEGKSAMALGNMTPEEYLKAYREAEKKSGGDKGLARKGAFTAAAKSALLGQSSSSVVYKNRQKGIVDWAKSVPNVGSAEDTFINGYFQEEMGDTLETAKGPQGQKKRD